VERGESGSGKCVGRIFKKRRRGLCKEGSRKKSRVVSYLNSRGVGFKDNLEGKGVNEEDAGEGKVEVLTFLRVKEKKKKPSL